MKAQEKGFKDYTPDTLVVLFGGYFEYDVVYLQINGIEVSRDLVYTFRSTSNSYLRREFLIFEQPEIAFKAILYRRHRSFNLEYNPLWWDWEADKDQSIYETPIIVTQKLIIKHGTNKYLLSYNQPKGAEGVMLHLEEYEK